MSVPSLEHGKSGSNPTSFVYTVPRQSKQLSIGLLAALGAEMHAAADEPKFTPDAEENMCVPAGYTYFGQFVDHDLTALPPIEGFGSIGTPINKRTPRLDLDCVYGDGPEKSASLYSDDGVTLRVGRRLRGTTPARHDLQRTSAHGEAIIGDPRNDENSIVSQIQGGFIRFHNEVVAALSKADPALKGAALYKRARQ